MTITDIQRFTSLLRTKEAELSGSLNLRDELVGSLGQHLDYSNWPDRERFMELDRAIEASRILAASQWRGPHRNAA